MPKDKKIEVTLDYSNYIQAAPVPPKSLYSTACSSDEATVSKWRDQWLSQLKANHAKFGNFEEYSIGKLHQSLLYRPAIIVGSGPSLKRNGEELRDRKGITALSCLHNYHFFEDRDIHIDYFVNLDAGEVTIEEVAEGGAKSPEAYWESTKNKTLLTFVGAHPELLKRWQGKVYFFNCPVPDPSYEKEAEAVEVFRTYISSGGNVLGACLYIAKAIFGANPIAFMGADFSFSYDKKFHGWDSKYDKNIGQVQRTVDVFGNKVLTWGSYHGFKCFFDWVAESIPGIYINCSEGGTFGAYNEGNIMSVKQMDFVDFLRMYHLSDELKECCVNPRVLEKKILY